MSEKINTDLRFHPGWDSQDTSGIDDDIERRDEENDAETGAVIGAVSGAVLGAIAGGAVGAVVGGVLGGVGAGAGVAAVERFENRAASQDDVRHPMSSPYPGDAGRREVVQVNGGGMYDMSDEAVASDVQAYPHAANDVVVASDPALGATTVPVQPVIEEDWRSELDGTTYFRLHGFAEAGRVAVAGTFNNWLPTANPMRYVDGVWLTEISLPPGKHQYRFVVDDDWIKDPHNPDNVTDSSGNLNSIVIVDRDVVQGPAAPTTPSGPTSSDGTYS